ncbi:CaiB/BaiF CoA transferase family protein [Streptomyces pacificus]|uniref:CoA transferase n=1 Tax=Streptomyces pacificus TaxID=2705029 RepID=A0A6A0AZA6_9ACTN|nr:CoA transferase [Streptomyces pacificus]GFH38289.1 CoA transferase [Streptomyces pacificus]
MRLADRPLAGVRVLDYAQYVAGPFATMLLADLGADVVKVEPPTGDAWRHYNPHAPGESTWFYALNRGKRSVALDLKTDEGRAASARLIAGADAVVHNMPPERAARFGLDRESVRTANPRTVWSCVTAFGTEGPDAGRLGYDIIAQALSGLLMADARPEDAVPRRSGGIAMADLTAGLLTCISVLAGVAGRERGRQAPGVEVSLLGAALAVQVQRFVRIGESGEAADHAPPPVEDHAPPPAVDHGPLTAAELDRTARATAGADRLEPYYRCYRTADSFLALACLNTAQRRRLLGILGQDDLWVADPQAAPADEAERTVRAELVDRFAAVFATRPLDHWLSVLAKHDIPAGDVRLLGRLFDDPQVTGNGLVQTVRQPGVGPVQLLGNVFKIDGAAAPAARPAPRLGEHSAELLGEHPVTPEAAASAGPAVPSAGPAVPSAGPAVPSAGPAVPSAGPAVPSAEHCSPPAAPPAGYSSPPSPGSPGCPGSPLSAPPAAAAPGIRELHGTAERNGA